MFVKRSEWVVCTIFVSICIFFLFSLRMLPPELMAIPPFAVHCSLYNINPKNDVWGVEAIQLFMQIID